ncbi:hypothetical protein HYW32_03760 [Candidatus Berkelbacteria bacterium]|nr:hypothetical protein [Candidatus Berkelbacteria bacterium]
MNTVQKIHPLMFTGGFALALITLGVPVLSIWFSFFVLGKISFFARILQINSYPLFSLAPGFILGVFIILIGLVLARKQNELALRWVTALVGGTIITSTIVAFWVMLLIQMPRFQIYQIAFEQTRWNQSSCNYSRVRQQMLSDLRTRAQGKTKAELEAMIGRPTDGQNSYCLGPEAHVIPIDRVFMQPIYSRDSRVTDLRITAS